MQRRLAVLHVPLGQLQVLSRARRPLLRVAVLQLPQVPDGEPGADAGTQALVKVNQGFGRVIACGLPVRVEQDPAEPRRPVAFAFEGQKTHLVDGVERAQPDRESSRSMMAGGVPR